MTGNEYVQSVARCESHLTSIETVPVRCLQMMLRIDNYRQVLSLCSFSKGLLTLCFDQAFMAVDGIGTVVSVLSGRVSKA